MVAGTAGAGSGVGEGDDCWATQRDGDNKDTVRTTQTALRAVRELNLTAGETFCNMAFSLFQRCRVKEKGVRLQ
jgi:hypothetical protein